MTEAQVERAKLLIETRDAIIEYLSARDPASNLVKSYLESQYEFQQKEGALLPKVETAEISILENADEDADSLYHSGPILRDVLERALHGALPKIDEELSALGVQS